MNYQNELRNFTNELLERMDEDERDDLLESDQPRNELEREVRQELENTDRFNEFLRSWEDITSDIVNRMEEELGVNLTN